MRRRPFLLFFCTLIFLYFPFELAWQWYRGHSLTTGDLFFSIIAPLCLIYGLLRVNRIGWYTLVGFGALWGVKDLYDIYATRNQNLLPILVHLGIYAMSVAYFINPRIRHVYFDPKLRWWRTKPRYETQLPCIVNCEQDCHYPVLSNISEGGCFLESPHLLSVNSHLQIAVPLPVPLNVSVLKAEGEVRWASNNPLRQGMGVQFINLTPLQSKAVKHCVKKQL